MLPLTPITTPVHLSALNLTSHLQKILTGLIFSQRKPPQRLRHDEGLRQRQQKQRPDGQMEIAPSVEEIGEKRQKTKGQWETKPHQHVNVYPARGREEFVEEDDADKPHGYLAGEIGGTRGRRE